MTNMTQSLITRIKATDREADRLDTLACRDAEQGIAAARARVLSGRLRRDLAIALDPRR